ncbi:MAG: NAD-glutamate dehydrogenase, partial [Simkania negevensis]|nr:NAD-glutamate dehydrogenase [Simkania negevensis]
MGEIKRSQQSLHALEKATETESKQFKEYYLWLQSHMPPSFFEEVDEQQLMLITHYLMGFPMQGYVSYIQLKEVAFALILDSPDVDQRILKYFLSQGIKHYQTFLSDAPPPFPGIKTKLRIAVILFTLLEEEENLLLSKEMQQEIYQKIYQIHSAITFESFQKLLYTMNPRFLRSLSTESLTHALLLYYRTIDRDYCQYELIQNEKWKEEKTNPSSIQILFAWKNIPKYRFLYRLAKMLSRHQLAITKMNASYVQPYQKGATLIMSLYLHGAKGQAAWEEADIDDLLKELVTLKYFSDEDEIERVFVTPLLVRGNIGNLLRSMIHFIHQILVPSNINLYTLSNIEEGLCHHPELTLQITHAFELKFDPKKHNLQRFEEEKNRIFSLIQKLDTGDELSDNRRKNILKQALFFAEFTLKTNFYRHNKSAFSFRLDPKYLDTLPYNRSDFFPELPFAIFFVQGMHFISFHIRFRDLARGGLRTIFPYKIEKMSTERNFIFSECYQLAYTQQKKNKDIPEGGAKAVIFLQPHESLARESRFYKEELLSSGKVEEEVEKRLATFNEEQRLEYLYQSQRAFIHSLLTLVNCFEDGTLKAKDIVDYWRKSEYLYLGPDENMHNVIIEWIAQYSLRCGYKCGAAFISSKPHGGINHKEFGVTSLGLNTYVKEVLKFLKINLTGLPAPDLVPEDGRQKIIKTDQIKKSVYSVLLEI